MCMYGVIMIKEINLSNLTKGTSQQQVVLHKERHHIEPHEDKVIINNELEDHEIDINKLMRAYEQYRLKPLEIPAEIRWQLKGLFDTMVATTLQPELLDEATMVFRDAIIDQLKGLFDTEERLGAQRLQAVLVEQSIKALETEMRQAEIRAENMRIMIECVKIAGKVSKGTASMEEIRFLQKHGIEMYAMAVALSKPKEDDDNKENETTTDIRSRDEGKINTAQPESENGTAGDVVAVATAQGATEAI